MAGTATGLPSINTAKRPNEAFIQPTAPMGPISRPHLMQLSYQQQQQQLQLQQHRLRQRQQQREQEQQPNQQTEQQQQKPDSEHQQCEQAVQRAPEASSISGGGCKQQLAVVQNKRKEKARIAARARRSQEAGIILEMAAELCISQDKLRRIDKATIVKLAIDYIRAHRALCQGRVSDEDNSSSSISSSNNNNSNNDNDETENEGRDSGEQKRYEPPLYSAPKLATASIFAPKTADNMNPHFLMIEEKTDGKGTFVLKPDTEILDEDDLTHLAPQAGDVSISLEVEPLEGISLADLLIPSPNLANQNLYQYNNNHQQQQISYKSTKRPADWRKEKSFYETSVYSNDWRNLSN